MCVWRWSRGWSVRENRGVVYPIEQVVWSHVVHTVENVVCGDATMRWQWHTVRYL